MIPQQSKTHENLSAALAGEARLAFLYQLWADRARSEGQFVTARLFEQTAKNEISHARLWYRLLCDQGPDTAGSLGEAAALEHAEWAESYATFARVAREEGFEEAARKLDLVAGIEGRHEQRFRQQLDALNGGELTHCPGAEWICQECGWHQAGDDAPQSCPVCGKGQGWFQKKG